MYRFKCDGQELRCIVHDTAASGYIDTVHAAFELCKRWDGMDVTVQYTQTQGGEEKTFNEPLVDGIAKVSNSLIDGPVDVSIFGYVRETGARLTSEPCGIRINRSGFKDNGEPSLPPKPDLYARLLHEVDEIVKKGISDRQVADAVNAHLAEHPPKVETDTTLAIKGDAADAAAVGEALGKLKNEKLAASALPTAIGDALAKAKASGEFDGAPGEDGRPGADGAPGKDGFTPTLSVERVEDGVQVKATNADGEQTETVYDGTKDVLVVPFTSGKVCETTKAEILAAVNAGKVCIAVEKDGEAYTYIGQMASKENTGYAVPTFAAPVQHAGGTKLGRIAVMQLKEDGIARTYGLYNVGIANPFPLKFTGAVNVEYDGSGAREVEIPAGGGSDDLFIVRISGAKADKTADEIIAAASEGKLCVAYEHTASYYAIYSLVRSQTNPVTKEYDEPTFESVRYEQSIPGVFFRRAWVSKDGTAVFGEYEHQHKKLTFKGAVNASYNGTKVVEVDIPEPGTGPAGTPGKDGFTPTLSLERVEGGVKVTATNKDGERSEIVYDGKDGAGGGGNVVILPAQSAIRPDETEAAFVVMSPPSQQLVVGQTYTVYWNGVNYTTEAKSVVIEDQPCVGLGSTDIFSGKMNIVEPFAIATIPPEVAAEAGFYLIIYPLDESTEVIVGITGSGSGGSTGGAGLGKIYLTLPEDYNGEGGEMALPAYADKDRSIQLSFEEGKAIIENGCLMVASMDGLDACMFPMMAACMDGPNIGYAMMFGGMNLLTATLIFTDSIMD